MSVRRVLPAALLLALAATLTAGPPAAADPVDPCTFTYDCEPVVGAAVGMAVPLVNPVLKGHDGGWDQFTSCCTQLNPAGAATASGLLDGRAARVVAGGGSEVLGSRVAATGTAAVVWAVSGKAYRYTRYASEVTRADGDPSIAWTVGSDVWSWSCVQAGPARDPLADCGTGTHRYTRGAAALAPPADPQDWAATVPVTLYTRTVNAAGAPLTRPVATSGGSWTLAAQTRATGWSWTVDWTVPGVGSRHVEGAASDTGTRVSFASGLPKMVGMP